MAMARGTECVRAYTASVAKGRMEGVANRCVRVGRGAGRYGGPRRAMAGHGGPGRARRAYRRAWVPAGDRLLAVWPAVPPVRTSLANLDSEFVSPCLGKCMFVHFPST